MRRPHPRTTYLVYVLGEGFAFRLMATIFSIFLVLELDLDPLQLLLMGTVLEGTYLVFEIPTGVVADTVTNAPAPPTPSPNRTSPSGPCSPGAPTATPSSSLMRARRSATTTSATRRIRASSTR